MCVMGLIAINNVIRRDSPIYYRHEYRGVAVVEFAGRKCQAGIDFVLETNPFGGRSVNVTIKDTIDYPVVTLQRELQAAIEQLDLKNKLPR